MTDTYAYEAFGTLRSRTGTTANEFTFAGEQTDPTGLQYLRARYYDPSIGRFWTRDPLGGAPSESQSWNPYVYVLNDPINLVDPLGLHRRPYHPNHCSIRDILGAVSAGVQVADLIPWGAIPFANVPLTAVSWPLDLLAAGFLQYDILSSACGAKQKVGLTMVNGLNLPLGLGGHLVAVLASPTAIAPPLIAIQVSAVETILYLATREALERCGDGKE